MVHLMHQKETLHLCILNYNPLLRVASIATKFVASRGREVGMPSIDIVP